MTKISEPVVFFGSGPVAAESLALLHKDFLIEAVITKPRPAHHKGDVPVIRTAEQLGLPIFTATNKLELDALFSKQTFQSLLGILIDFGIIVSQKIIDAFPKGIVNSHFSLLPQLRGADPITFAILEGHRETGVSLMLLVEAMDEGPLLARTHFTMPNDVTTPELTKNLTQQSYEALRTIIPQYLAGKIKPSAQPTQPVSYSRRLTKEDGLIDWQKSAIDIEREIRAFIEWPKSRTAIGNLEIIITKASVIDAEGEPGHAVVTNGQLIIYCGKGALVIERLKPAGKKEMPGKAFLAGYKDLFLS